ncbi:phenoloxidase-activating factor 2-like [Pollicipes pollicipes]|uniref:phenoloxidase-activating factor 2-like n=1 Tax=Pollicipes pollicipes TaxID=41117 RepID=UPI0018851160|nr:phenoloxidase-activating factor 2-like [Pollicipes pollicipes]
MATGWGQESFDNTDYPSILKEVRLSKVDQGQCQSRMRETRLGRWFRLHDTFLCAGGHPGVDTCKGDGGSPLVCRDHSKREETHVQIGIVAWGINCGRGGMPGVYADVIKLLPWIQEKLALLTASPSAGY